MAIKSLVVWVSKPYANDELFRKTSSLNRDNCLSPFHALKDLLSTRGWDCHTQDVALNSGAVPDAVLFSDMPEEPVSKILGGWYGKTRLLLVLAECEVIKPCNWDMSRHKEFDAIFTWRESLLDNSKYFKLNFSMSIPSAPLANEFRDRFCVMIAGNKKRIHPLELYSEREQAIRWFEKNHPEEFHLYGIGWDRRIFSGPKIFRALNRVPGLSRMLAPSYPSYMGRLPEKLPVLSKYKYSICYENAKEIPGYITEKIFDCLFSGCVPVYWGAPDIEKYVPSNCFIDRRRFQDHEELYAYMKNMPDQEYNAYLAAAREYLAGPLPYQFSDKCYAETICRVITNG